MIVTRRLRMKRKTTSAGEEAAEQQVQLDLLERLADEPRLVARRLDLDVGRQRRLDPLEPREHAIDDRDGVGARLLADRHRDGVLAVEPRLAAHLLVGVGHARRRRRA